MKKERKSLLKRLSLFLFGSVFFLFVVLTLLVQLPFFQQTIKDVIQSRVEKVKGLEVSFNRVGGFLPLTISVSDLKVSKDGKPVVMMDKLRFTPSLWSILYRRPILHSVYGDNVSLYYVKTTKESGESAVTFPAPPPLDLQINSFHMTETTLFKQGPEDTEPVIVTPTPMSLHGYFHFNPSDLKLLFSVDAHPSTDPNMITGLDVTGHVVDDQLAATLHLRESQGGMFLEIFKLKNFTSANAIIRAKGPVRSWMGAALNRSIGQTDDIVGDFDFSLTPDPVWSNPVHLAIFSNQLKGNGSFTYNREGLTTIRDIDVASNMIKVKGSIAFDRKLSFKDSALEASVDLDQLNPALDSEVKGTIKGNGQFVGSLPSPRLDIQLKSDRLIINGNSFEKVDANTQTLFDGKGLGGNIKAKCNFNDSPAEFDADYKLSNQYEFSISNIHLRFPRTKLRGDVNFKSPTGLMNGKIDIDTDRLSILSPYIKIPVNGRLKGTLLLSTAPSPDVDHKVLQTANLNFDIERARIATIRSDNITGDINVIDPFGNAIVDVKATALNGQLQELTFSELSIATLIDVKKTSWDYDLELAGRLKEEMNFTSTGSWSYYDKVFVLSTEELQGIAFDHQFSLVHEFLFESSPSKMHLSPLRLSVTALEGEQPDKGLLFAELDKTEQSIHLNCTMDNFTLSFLYPLFPSLPFTGIASGQLFLSGTQDSLVGSSKLDLREIKLLERAYAQAAPFAGRFESEYSNDTLTVSSDIKSEGVQNLLLKGQLPLTLGLQGKFWNFDRGGNIDLSIQGQGELAPLMQLFITDTTRVSGMTSLDFQLTGTVDEPELQGSGELTDGRYESLYAGSKLQDINATFIGDGSVLKIVDVSANDGYQGKITGQGSIELNPEQLFPYVVDLNLDNARVLAQDYAVATCSGNHRITGNMKRGKLQGELEVNNAVVTIPPEFPTKIYSVDVQYINLETYEELPTLPRRKVVNYPLELDMEINATSNTVLNGRGLESDWKGSVKVLGTADSPLVYGKLVLRKGEFKFAQRVFVLSEGVISFDGNPKDDSRVSLTAKLELTDITVMIGLKGPLKDLDIDFYSVPPLPEKDVLSHVLFNKPIQEIEPGQGLQLANKLISLKEGSGPDILGKIGKGIGLDRIDINTQTKYLTPEGETGDKERINEVSVRVGKYISKDVYVSVNKAVNTTSKQVAVEARLARQFKLEGEIGDDTEAKISLKWKRDY